MEAEMGPQVAAPPRPPVMNLFHGVPPSSNRKTSRSQQHDRSSSFSPADTSSDDPSSSDWSPEMWRWDPVAFTLKPSSSADRYQGTREEAHTRNGLSVASSSGDQGSPSLMGHSKSSRPIPGDSAARPNKRVRADSPDSCNRNKQMCCQVDDCNADLTKQRDYHRRHKVCEIHSKALNALVGNQMQRFCQQCSRFHLLLEFDEGKRSCRARLAGHNRRRRKARPEEASSMPAVSSQHDSNASMSSKIVNVLAILARIHDSSSLVKSVKSSRIADADCLNEVVGTLNSFHTSNSRKDLPVCENLDLNLSHDPVLSEFPSEENNGHNISTALDLRVDNPTPASPVTHSSTIDKIEKSSLEPSSDVSSDNNSSLTVPSHRLKWDKDALPSTLRVGECNDESRLTLQLFNVTSDDVTMNMPLSSGMSRIIEKQCPSKPVTHDLFPLCPTTQTSANGTLPVSVGNSELSNENIKQKQIPPVKLFSNSVNIGGECSSQVSPRHSSLLSNALGLSDLFAGSDLSQMDRTGRILFKLFDKHPSDIPNTLRIQILDWLSNSPSDMESYIRPGCIVLSVYLSMSSVDWDDLQKNLLSRLQSLIQCSNSDFWRNGRLVVNIGHMLFFHDNGKVRPCNHEKISGGPEILLVSPLAVVSGNETTLLLHGRNLKSPGTKIHYTYMGGYISKEVQPSYHSGTLNDDTSSETLLFPGGPPGTYGRCYIEVEHIFSGNSFPIIIADSSICEELSELEVEIKGATNMMLGRQKVDYRGSSLREDIIHFLEELGWLFQRSNIQSSMCLRQFSVTRFMFLVLFSTERGWSALLKKLLDIAVQLSLDKNDLADRFLKSVNEVCPLKRALKGKYRKMVDMLLNYSVEQPYTCSKVYLFPPNSMGPAGITPLHLAASMEDSEDMVDALTNDPQGLGLAGWKSILDDTGLSPYDYASLRNHDMYNKLVDMKLENKRNSEVSITVYEEEISSTDMGGPTHPVQSGNNPSPSSCSQCAILGNMRLRGIIEGKSMKYRPYAHSLLAIAMVCMCVCVFLRGAPEIGLVAPFKWRNIGFGTM